MFELIPRPNGGEPGDTKEGIVHFDIDAMNGNQTLHPSCFGDIVIWLIGNSNAW